MKCFPHLVLLIVLFCGCNHNFNRGNEVNPDNIDSPRLKTIEIDSVHLKMDADSEGGTMRIWLRKSSFDFINCCDSNFCSPLVTYFGSSINSNHLMSDDPCCDNGWERINGRAYYLPVIRQDFDSIYVTIKCKENELITEEKLVINRKEVILEN